MKTIWLNEDLKQKIRNVFEPEYQSKLSNEEVILIARNLTGFMESYIKFKLRQNENKTIYS